MVFNKRDAIGLQASFDSKEPKGRDVDDNDEFELPTGPRVSKGAVPAEHLEDGDDLEGMQYGLNQTRTLQLFDAPQTLYTSDHAQRSIQVPAAYD